MGLLSAIGNGFNRYLDRGVNASLAGVPPGLLNTAQTGIGPTAPGAVPMMTPQDRQNLRMNYLMHLGQGIAQMQPAAHLDEFRDQAIKSATDAYQMRQQQALQGAMSSAFSPESAPAAPPAPAVDDQSAAPAGAAPVMGGTPVGPTAIAPPQVPQSPNAVLAAQLRKAASNLYKVGQITAADNTLKRLDEIMKLDQNQSPPIVGRDKDGKLVYYTPKAFGDPTPTNIAAEDKDRYVAVGTTHVLDHATGTLAALPKDKSIVEVNGSPAIQNPDLTFTTLSGDPIDPASVKQYNPKPTGVEKEKTPEQKAFDQALIQSKGDPLAAYRLVKTNPEVTAATAENRQMRQDAQEQTRSDNSYKFNVGQLDNAAKPFQDTLSRLSRLQDTLSQNSPQADSLVAPQLLTVLAGGQGSGLRMNEAEISRIVGGRSNWESLKAAASMWQLDPEKAHSITPAQRTQIRALADALQTKLQAKQDMINSARTQLLGTQNPLEHRRIVSDATRQLNDWSGGSAAGQPSANHEKLINLIQGLPNAK